MDNIFEGARFGDKYVRRNGHIVIFLKFENDTAVVTNERCWLWNVPLNGIMFAEAEGEMDIVGRYEDVATKVSGNVFDGAKFGDKFVTRDGHLAVLISYNQRNEQDPYILAVQCYDNTIKSVSHKYYQNGKVRNHDDGLTIIGRISDTSYIDSSELESLASTYDNIEKDRNVAIKQAYKAGFCKAREVLQTFKTIDK